MVGRAFNNLKRLEQLDLLMRSEKSAQVNGGTYKIFMNKIPTSLSLALLYWQSHPTI